jgi:hypothetical protein
MILYHYCSSEAFLKIITGRNIRLSMLDMSNDLLEGKWVHSVIEEEVRSREKTKNRSDQFMRAVETATSFTFAAGFCLSEKSDQLSQWRGYADDGFGFALGFDAEYLRALGTWYRDNRESGFGLQKVNYDVQDYHADLSQILSMAESALEQGALTFPTLFDHAGEGAEEKALSRDKATKRFYSALSPLMFLCHHIKNPAFKEEQEWRLISVLMNSEAPVLKVEDHCDFRSARDRLIPYRSVELIDLSLQPVPEVVIGPRNISRIDYVKAMLSKHGFTDVKINRSLASYR